MQKGDWWNGLSHSLVLYFIAVFNLNRSLLFTSSRSLITFSSREKVIKKRPAQSSQVE